MKLNKREQVKPNLAGLTSQVQRTEIKLILAGAWPPLKPLPVFKYGTDDYRAEIHFDSVRGEWVCRKTSFPSNKVQELRGALTEMTMTLPHGQAEDFTEAVTEQQEQELENEAHHRLQAILEWREKYGNGALYSELRKYLSESQQDEIYDSIRMTLTARQLQFNPKNVEFVFDALWNAGGRLATLMEIAQRNKAEQEANPQAQAKAAALDAERQVPVEAIRDEKPAARYAETFPSESTYAMHTTPVDEVKPRQGPFPIPAATPVDAGVSMFGPAAEISIRNLPQGLEASFPSERARNSESEPIRTSIPELSEPVGSHVPATLENFPTEPIGSFSPGQVQSSVPQLMAPAAPQASEIVAREIPDASAQSLVEDLREKMHHRTPVADFGPQVRTDRVESPADRIEDSPSHFHVLEISRFQVAAFLLLFAVIGLTVVGLTVGRGSLEKHFRGAQKSILAVDDTSPAMPNRPGETTSPTSTPAATNIFNTPAVNPPASETKESRTESPSAQSLNARPADSTTRVRPTGPYSAVTSRSNIDSPKAVGPVSGAPRNPSPRRVMLATAASPHPSPPSAILVRGPGDGSKPFTLILPEKAIAASSSFAMKSQLSVLVAPEAGRAVTNKPSRLQAGDLVSYAWPRYPRAGDQYESTETVKVRATIGQLGHVTDVKFVKGSISLLPATMSAIRRWRYKPTLLNGRPVQAQQDVTIEFRPPQYVSHVRTQRPSHN